MKIKLTAVVIPCHNEEGTLYETYASLNSDLSRFSPVLFVFVDNGSTDRTREVMEAVHKESSEPILIISEPEIGWVPSRRAGIEAVRLYATSHEISTTEVLIIQADADTTYGKGYIGEIQKAARYWGTGTLLQGINEPKMDGFKGFFELMQKTDQFIENRLVGIDLIADDKGSAFFLSDYDAWGGHRREYGEDGIEIHNSTSRLFLRGFLVGAKKEEVIAPFWHSRRRFEEHAAYFFATAGVTRSVAFKDAWIRAYTGPTDIKGFLDSVNTLEVQRVIRERTAHVLGLFRWLPLIVLRAGGDESPDRVIAQLPRRTEEDLTKNAALAFQDMFTIIDQDHSLLTLRKM